MARAEHGISGRLHRCNHCLDRRGDVAAGPVVEHCVAVFDDDCEAAVQSLPRP